MSLPFCAETNAQLWVLDHIMQRPQYAHMWDKHLASPILAAANNAVLIQPTSEGFYVTEPGQVELQGDRSRLTSGCDNCAIRSRDWQDAYPVDPHPPPRVQLYRCGYCLRREVCQPCLHLHSLKHPYPGCPWASIVLCRHCLNKTHHCDCQ